LITNNYAANNGNLTSSVYGNGNTISFAYDRFNRLTQKTLSNGTINYTYDARANLAKTVDGVNSTTETYSYDLADRLTKVTNTNGLTSQYTYDQNSLVNTAKYTLGTQTNTTTYNFTKENRLSSINIGTNKNIQMNYDSLSRVTTQVLTSGANTYTTQFTYENTSTPNRTTTSIASMKNGNNDTLSYTYDALGNIETITEGTILKQKYYYDALSQLIREDNVDLNKTIAYSYNARPEI